MLAYPIGPEDFAALNPEDFRAEWKWDGIRIQAVAVTAGEQRAARLWSRSGEDISAAFPEMVGLLRAAAGDFALDGQLLVVRDGLVQPASVARQRLNRRTVSPKSIADFPSHIRCYDLLMENGEDLRALGSDRRRARLEALIARLRIASIDLSPLVPFGTWDELAAARAKPDNAGAAAIEGVVLKRRDSPYIAGRVRGPWWTWKNDPIAIDAVLMYVRRGHGEHASFWSDCTFGVWRTVNGAEELVPVGEACLGFSDGDPIQLDRWVRDRTVNRFGPVREVAAGRDDGLVLEIAFEGLDRSTRRKSGIALRVPRVASIRWDKPPREADRLETLEALLRG
jgi:DNA ligase-1